MKRLLLISNSTNFGEGYLDHVMDAILERLGPIRRVLYVPFALFDRDGYTRKARARLADEGIEVDGLTADAAGADQVARAAAIFVGGGNAFRLLNTVQRAGLVGPIRERVLGGMPYIGASAGINIAAPTIMTTNDMPIVEPESFAALNLVPFQINPHYLDPIPGLRHTGETRELRLMEFLEENDRLVVGLREGSWLRVDGPSLRLEGKAAARIFARGQAPQEVEPGAVLDHLLRSGAA
ncbi:MAG: dipeptidase PepE [Acidobacteria bacterium]|nr:dipeptidase PepE [Acidobacteriota bacterium]